MGVPSFLLTKQPSGPKVAPACGLLVKWSLPAIVPRSDSRLCSDFSQERSKASVKSCHRYVAVQERATAHLAVKQRFMEMRSGVSS